MEWLCKSSRVERLRSKYFSSKQPLCTKFHPRSRLTVESRAMKFRRPLFWLMSGCAWLVLFIGQKLNAVGEMIASELERSYPGPTGYVAIPGRKRQKSPVELLRQAKWQAKRNKLSGDSVPQ
jgi:hypothetical protein